MPLSILTPQLPNSHPNLTSRLPCRTFQPPAVRLTMAGKLCLQLPRCPGYEPSCVDSLASDALLAIPARDASYHIHTGPDMRRLSGQSIQQSSSGNSSNFIFQGLRTAASALCKDQECLAGILTPSCPLEPHGRGQPPDSSTQSLGQHLLSKMKTRVED